MIKLLAVVAITVSSGLATATSPEQLSCTKKGNSCSEHIQCCSGSCSIKGKCM